MTSNDPGSTCNNAALDKFFVRRHAVTSRDCCTASVPQRAMRVMPETLGILRSLRFEWEHGHHGG